LAKKHLRDRVPSESRPRAPSWAKASAVARHYGSNIFKKIKDFQRSSDTWLVLFEKIDMLNTVGYCPARVIILVRYKDC